MIESNFGFRNHHRRKALMLCYVAAFWDSFLLISRGGRCTAEEVVSSSEVAAAEFTAGNRIEHPSDSESIRALVQITEDVREHLKKPALMQKSLEQLHGVLQQTEVDWGRIKREQSRQFSLQLAALEASNFWGELASELDRDLRAAVFEPTDSPFVTQYKRLQAPRVALAKAQSDLNILGRSEEIRQLDAVSLSVVNRRMDTFREMIDLQQKWVQWQLEYASFLARYWPHSDPERKFSEDQINQRIEVLLQASDADFAAMITCSLLNERLGELDKAWSWMERAAQGAPFFESTILHLRLSLLSAMKKNREAKLLIPTLTKLPSISPYDRWIKARWLAGEKNWSGAELEWKKLTSEKEFRIAAHRALSLSYLAKKEANSAAREKAFKEATTAMDLDPAPDWFAYFVLANASAATQRTDEAEANLQKAKEMSDEGNQTLCDELSEAIKAQKYLVWSVNRRIIPAP
ncbi:tetratricopeptide repeat protein [Pirellulaceae bacterium SH501]